MKYLLPPVKQYFKACLHTHSTVSDGILTPEEVRDAYREEGYSILALTDHSVTVAHQELNLPDFLMLTGVEVDIEDSVEPNGDTRGRNRHFCLISKDPNRQWIPFRDPAPIPRSVPYEAFNEIGNIERVYTDECCNETIAESNRQGFLVTYNHPCWSLESYPDYTPMKGLWAMEYRNTASIGEGYDENNGRVYQDFLNLGNRMVPIMADDMHRPCNKQSGDRVLGGSWTMIGAEKLEYASVIEAMERGDLYASCGPEITGLTWDDGKLTVTCSRAARIQVITQTRFVQLAIPKDGQPLTGAEFDMAKWVKRSAGKENCFLRVIVTDEKGGYAVSRAYWLDELNG